MCAEGLSSSSLESSLGGGQTHEESWKGARPSPEIFLLFDLKKERSDAVFKLDLTEETRTQLQEEETIASSCLILATPMPVCNHSNGASASLYLYQCDARQ